LLDRIDLHLTLSPVPLQLLGSSNGAETSGTIRQRVEAARARQRSRYAAGDRLACNAQASGRVLVATLTDEARRMLTSAADSLSLSARAYHRVVKVARTIADLAMERSVEVPHAAEALRFRSSQG
jgi:magnesium chelatase family protein